MRIALDYDNTYTADPTLWRHFVYRCRERGHEVFIVTARDERFDRTPDLVDIEHYFKVVWCRGVAKRWWCSHFGPGAFDVWIDDKPEAILFNSTATPDELVAWRATHPKETQRA